MKILRQFFIALLAISIVSFNVNIADAKNYSGGSSRPSSSSGSHSLSSHSSSAPSRTSSSSKSYSSGKSSSAKVGPGSSKRTAVSPPKSNFMSQAAHSNKQDYAVRSEQTKTAPRPPPSPRRSIASFPKATYTMPAGKTQDIHPNDPQITYLRGKLDGIKYQQREQRQRDFYGDRWDYWRAHPSHYTYNDHISPWFWMWLIERHDNNQQALYLYHHRDVMDASRYDSLINQNAELKAKVNALEMANVRRDPTYTPPGVDPDIQYEDNYVTAAYNPTYPPVNYDTSSNTGRSHATGAFFGSCFEWLLLLLIVGLVIYLIFFMRWKNL